MSTAVGGGGCGRGKHIHENAAAAQRHVRTLKRDNRSQKGRQECRRMCIFYCAPCGGWHVGRERDRGVLIGRRR